MMIFKKLKLASFISVFIFTVTACGVTGNKTNRYQQYDETENTTESLHESNKYNIFNEAEEIIEGKYGNIYENSVPGETLKGKYAYNDGRFDYTLEFKSNGACIFTDNCRGYIHTRSGTYEATDGGYYASFAFDDEYLPTVYGVVVNGSSLDVTLIAGEGSPKGGVYTRVDSGTALSDNTSGVLTGSYGKEEGSYYCKFEFSSNGTCTFFDNAPYKHTRVGKYEYADGEYIATFPLDTKYLETIYSIVTDGNVIHVELLAGMSSPKGGDFYAE